MKCRAAVLNKMGAPRPYMKSKPITIEEIELDEPGDGEVLIKMEQPVYVIQIFP